MGLISKSGLYKTEHGRWEQNASFYRSEPDSPYYQYLHKCKIDIDGPELFSGKIVADIGAGSGYFLNKLREKVSFFPLVIDYSFAMLKNVYAGGNGSGIVRLQADAQELPLKDESADIVVLHGALHHFKAEGIYCVTVEEIDRILKPGGYVCVYDRNGSVGSRVVHTVVLYGKKKVESICGSFSSSSSNVEPDFNDEDLGVFLRNGFVIEKRTFVSTIPFFLMLVFCNTVEYILKPQIAGILRKITFPVALIFERFFGYKCFTVEQCLVMRKHRG